MSLYFLVSLGYKFMWFFFIIYFLSSKACQSDLHGWEVYNLINELIIVFLDKK